MATVNLVLVEQNLNLYEVGFGEGFRVGGPFHTFLIVVLV